MMIPGVTITMGSRDWLVPPLTLGQLRRLMPRVRQLTEIDASMSEVQIGVLVEIVAAALQRNYPDATAEMVENLLDLGNAGTVLNAVLTGSGLRLRERRLGEASAPGPGPGQRRRLQISARSKRRRGLGTYLWPPRYRLRLQLPRNRRNDALRFRRAYGVLGRSSTTAHPSRGVSRHRQAATPAVGTEPCWLEGCGELKSRRDPG